MNIFLMIIRLSICIFLLSACSPPPEDTVNEAKRPIPVRVMLVESQALQLVVESIGRLMPNREVTLSSEIGGVVEKYMADTGDAVKKDQILLRIDPTDYRLALKEAEANLAMAQSRLELAAKTYERSKTLLPREVITPEDFDRVEVEYLTARASLKRVEVLVDIAKERLKKTRIHSPFSGLIAERLIEIGQTVGAGQPVMTLLDLNPMRVKIYLAEQDYVQLERDDPVRIIVEAYPGEVFSGRIDRIDIKADERTNTFGIEILLKNSNLMFKAGMTARVGITINTIPDTILIPQSTVLYKKDRKQVFVVGKDRRAELRLVELGRSKDDRIQITKGLLPGDQLIVTGGQYLKSGDSILISAFGQTATP